MRAGAGKAEIALVDDYLEIENFALIHRSLNARALVIEEEKQAVILSLEVTSLPDRMAEEIRNRIAKSFGLKREGIWVCVTHTFSAPHLLPDHLLETEEKKEKKRKYAESLIRASLEAVNQAMCNLQTVTVRLGSGYCDINTNRDIKLKDGWWIGENGLGLCDHRVSVLQFDNEKNEAVAVVFHYSIQSSVLDGSYLSAGGKAVTPDVAGIASDYVEKNFTSGTPVALFLLGAAGDQAPVERAVSETFVEGMRIRKDRQEEGFTICERLGGQLGETVCHIAEELKKEDVLKTERLDFGKISFHVPGKEMERELKKLHPVKNMEYKATEDVEIEVEILAMGNLALVGVKPELNCISAAALRTCSAYPYTLVCTMVNGASKYMADRDSYDRFTYEAMNSPFGKGAAEILVKQTLGLLETMK